MLWDVSVKQHIYHILGVLAEVYPEKMIMYSDKLLEVYIRALKIEVSSCQRLLFNPISANEVVCSHGSLHNLIMVYPDTEVFLSVCMKMFQIV